HRGHARLFQRRELALGRARTARGDRARVAHALALRRRGTGAEAHHRLGHVFADELGRFLFGTAADLADQDDALGLRVVLEQLQRVDEVGAIDRVATAADSGRLDQPRIRGLLHRYSVMRARARDDYPLAGL